MTKTIHDSTIEISRRKFIVGSAAVAGGGLALGFDVPLGIRARRRTPATKSASGS